MCLTYSILLTIERAKAPENRIPAGRPKRGRSADCRLRPGPRFRPGVGGPRASGRKRPKCLFLQCFAVGRAFLEPRGSVSCFWKTRSRGQCRYESAKRGGSEGLHCPDGSGESLKDSGKRDENGMAPGKAVLTLSSDLASLCKRQDSLSRTLSNGILASVGTPRKGLTDSLKREVGDCDNAPERPH